MTLRAVELLEAQMGEAFEMLCERLDGLTDDEFGWEPVPGAWAIHPDERGMWIADYEEPDPIPAPITTIGWRIVHVADCKLMYQEYAFGPGRLQWPELEAPHTSSDALRALDERQAKLMDAVRAMSDHELDVERMTNWGEPWPAWRILWTMVHHARGHLTSSAKRIASFSVSSFPCPTRPIGGDSMDLPSTARSASHWATEFLVSPSSGPNGISDSRLRTCVETGATTMRRRRRRPPSRSTTSTGRLPRGGGSSAQ